MDVAHLVADIGGGPDSRPSIHSSSSAWRVRSKRGIQCAMTVSTVSHLQVQPLYRRTGVVLGVLRSHGGWLGSRQFVQFIRVGVRVSKLLLLPDDDGFILSLVWDQARTSNFGSPGVPVHLRPDNHAFQPLKPGR
jgi:hypothetical protein